MSHDMETEFADLAQALNEARPTPEPEFTEKLDQAVADHFPPEWASEAALGKKNEGGIGSLAERFRRRMGGRRVLLPAVAGFAGLLMVATVVVGAVESGRFQLGGGQGDDGAYVKKSDGKAVPMQVTTSKDERLEGLPRVRELSAGTAASPAIADQLDPASGASGGAEESANSTDEAPSRAGVNLHPESFADAGKSNRDVAREAEITLGTDPDGVQDVANEIVSVTDEHNGIVMDSKVTDGKEGAAGATFRLLIPSGQIESAVAELSGIANLKSRSQELTDITAPVSKTEDAVTDSKAKIKSLQGQLEETFDEEERANLERRIRWERFDLRAAESRLERLERRVDYTPVMLRVETSDDGSSDSSPWGLSEAIDDAGKLLGVAAGVTVLALAVAIPIGIVVLIALALNRAWVRRSRRRALADDE